MRKGLSAVGSECNRTRGGADSPRMRARSAIGASVMPSKKYFCCHLPRLHPAAGTSNWERRFLLRDLPAEWEGAWQRFEPWLPEAMA